MIKAFIRAVWLAINPLARDVQELKERMNVLENHILRDSVRKMSDNLK